ncbi:MAG: DUF3592 domain-containing protein [Woeseiaceae bacterium]|nr:DUF3592 domain-containing protein [Woeseiaceae bacterium]
MKGRILAILFALPFIGVGVWMGWSIGKIVHDSIEMRSWQPVQATLTSAGYTTHRGESDTWEAYAEYSYRFDGRPFVGFRVTIDSGGDNIGNYHRNMGDRLRAIMASGEPITVWVDPDNPQDSIIDREIRWGIVGFKSIFVLLFGGFGLGILIAAIRAPKEKDEALPRYQEAPWLLNDKWQTESVFSDSKSSMWSAWMFAAIWNLISAFLPFMIYEEVTGKENYLALIGLLFPLIGIGLLVWAIRRTLEWRRFGPTPVSLDPFPGSIGGHVGGTIETRLPYDASHRFFLTLTSVHSFMSGSGKNRSRHENVLWQHEVLAHTESGVRGTRIAFRFDVPEDLRESEAAPKRESYNLWRLNLRAEIPGTDLDRNFEIPVYATARLSRHLSQRSVDAAEAEGSEAFDAAVRDDVRVSFDGVRKRLVYPMGRNFLSNLAGFVITGAFAAAGAYMIIEEGQTLFGGIFGGFGALFAVVALYMMFRSLDVRAEGNTITSIRRWLGIPVRVRRMQRSDFYRFEKDTNNQTQNGKNVRYYSVRAIDKNANEMVLGEGFRGEAGADAAIRFLTEELRLQDRSADGYDAELVNQF